ncbi:hypothetical protein LTR60_001103 [Cryomyces antarcticus]|nr:hypothetical protein LTR39_001029 [Cryomyces antarcticus]KAK5019490.1 hypothetical protein LTR60_001103 [Cryomyces antarcticus]
MFKIYTWKEYECDHHRECAEIGFDVGRRYGRREGIEIGEARVERETKADGYAVRELAHRERLLERREREIYGEGESRRIESFGGDGLLPGDHRRKVVLPMVFVALAVLPAQTQRGTEAMLEAKRPIIRGVSSMVCFNVGLLRPTTDPQSTTMAPHALTTTAPALSMDLSVRSTNLLDAIMNPFIHTMALLAPQSLRSTVVTVIVVVTTEPPRSVNTGIQAAPEPRQVSHRASMAERELITEDILVGLRRTHSADTKPLEEMPYCNVQ